MADSGNILREDTSEEKSPPPQQDEKVTLSRAEIDSLRRERDEARESERYWASQARAHAGNGNGNSSQPQQEAADDGPNPDEFLDPNEQQGGIEGDTPEKLVDEFASQGVAALSKRGFITASDAKKIAVEAALHVTQELINRERQKMGTDTQIMSEFPELRDPDSDLFKATAVRYQRAVAMDPNAKKSPAALYLAAEAARESLKRTSKPPPDDDEYEDRGRTRETERDRRARAAAQDSRPNGRQEIDDMDMLGPEARQVAKLMGITPEEFQKSRKELGVGPRRRPR